MAKNVFQPMEIIDLTSQKFTVEAPMFESEEPEPLDLYEGPTADDLRREAESFKEHWAEEKKLYIQQAEDEAEKIKQEAMQVALDAAKIKTDEAMHNKEIVDDEVERIRDAAEADAQKIRNAAEEHRDMVFAEALAKAQMEGRKSGWEEGFAEIERLTERLHSILNAAIEKRKDIIEETETQLIDLVLLITHKVVKAISESQKNVVINNIVQSLRKLKSRGDVAIRVNLADLDLTTEHLKDFTRMVEDVKSITVMEDSSVERGGAIIETDFGQIDARISSQLKIIEDKIRELVPLQSVGEN